MNVQKTRRAAPMRALVTGSSQGLGRAIACECAARGMDLFLVALPGSGLEQVAQGIAAEWDVRVDWLELDLTQDDATERLVGAMKSAGFEVDLLVNNAGIGTIGLFSGLPLDNHEAVIRLNVLALVRLTHALVGDLMRRESAYILNVASLGAYFPMPNLPIYSATKSFVLTFSQALRDELWGRVGVGVLCPNTIRNDRATEDYVDRLPLICRWACLYPSQIAREGIGALLRGKAIIVPGFLNRMLRVICPFVPRFLVAGTIRNLWGGFSTERKDAASAR